MARQYTDGGRKAPRYTGSRDDGPSLPPIRTWRERLGTLKNIGPFLALVWRTSPGLATASLTFRLVRALLPVAALYVGKLIIDAVVALVQMPQNLPSHGTGSRPAFSTMCCCCSLRSSPSQSCRISSVGPCRSWTASSRSG